MNKNFLAILLLYSFAQINAGLPADVKKPSDEKPLKYRIVEGRKVVSETVEGKELEARLLETRNQLEKEIKDLDKQIEKSINDVKLRGRTVDQEVLEKDQERIKEMAQTRETKAQASQEKFNKAFNRELGKFNQKIKDTIAEVAKEKDWDIVALKETGEIIYTSPRIEVSDEIIRKHDSKFKASKAKAPVAPAKKTT